MSGEEKAARVVQSERVDKPRIKVIGDSPMSVRTNVKTKSGPLGPLVPLTRDSQKRAIPRGESLSPKDPKDPKSPGRVANIDDIKDEPRSPMRRINTPRPEYKVNGQVLDVSQIQKIKSPQAPQGPQDPSREVKQPVEGVKSVRANSVRPIGSVRNVVRDDSSQVSREPGVMSSRAGGGVIQQSTYVPPDPYVPQGAPYVPQGAPYVPQGMSYVPNQQFSYAPQGTYAPGAYVQDQQFSYASQGHYAPQVVQPQGETSIAPAAVPVPAQTADEGPESTMSREEIVAEYLFRFRMIKRRYPHMEITAYDSNSDPEIMKKDYKRILNQITVEETASGYKLYLVVFIMLVELFYVKVLKLEKAKGFTKSQVMVLSNYQKLLLELGEKDYGGFGAGWPVEVRIAGLVGINSLVFLLGNHIFESAGGEIFTTLMSSIRAPGPSIDSPAQGGDGGGGLAGMLGGLMGMLNGGGGGLGNILNGLGGNGGNNSSAESLNKDGTMRPPPDRKRRKKAGKQD